MVICTKGAVITEKEEFYTYGAGGLGWLATQKGCVAIILRERSLGELPSSLTGFCRLSWILRCRHARILAKWSTIWIDIS